MFNRNCIAIGIDCRLNGITFYLVTISPKLTWRLSAFNNLLLPHAPGLCIMLDIVYGMIRRFDDTIIAIKDSVTEKLVLLNYALIWVTTT